MNSLLRLSVAFDLQMGPVEWLINGGEQVSVKDLLVFPSNFSSTLPGVTLHSFLLIWTISSQDSLLHTVFTHSRVMTEAKTLGQACKIVLYNKKKFRLGRRLFKSNDVERYVFKCNNYTFSGYFLFEILLLK